MAELKAFGVMAEAMMGLVNLVVVERGSERRVVEIKAVWIALGD